MSSTGESSWQLVLPVQITTFVAGPLSRLGHDLTFEGKVQVVCKGSSLSARLDVRNLKIARAARDGVVRQVSERDQSKILGNMLGASVLNAAKNPVIELCVAVDALSVGALCSAEEVRTALVCTEEAGLAVKLSILGCSLDEMLHCQAEGQSASLRLDVQPSRYGIAPFRAMLGALQLQDRVGVVVHWPAGAVEETTDLRDGR